MSHKLRQDIQSETTLQTECNKMRHQCTYRKK